MRGLAWENWLHFNPRSREGSDCMIASPYNMEDIFQSTLP